VLAKSEELDPEQHPPVRGVDFNDGVSLEAIMAGLSTSGFQATELGRAIEVLFSTHRFQCDSLVRHSYAITFVIDLLNCGRRLIA